MAPARIRAAKAVAKATADSKGHGAGKTQATLEVARPPPGTENLDYSTGLAALADPFGSAGGTDAIIGPVADVVIVEEPLPRQPLKRIEIEGPAEPPPPKRLAVSPVKALPQAIAPLQTNNCVSYTNNCFCIHMCF